MAAIIGTRNISFFLIGTERDKPLVCWKMGFLPIKHVP